MRNEIQRHLEQFHERKRVQPEMSVIDDQEQEARLKSLREYLAVRMQSEVLPVLEDAAASIRESGYHAVASLAEEDRGGSGYDSWIMASVLLQCGQTPHVKQLYDLTLLGEIDTEHNTWRIHSFVSGSQGSHTLEHVYAQNNDETLAGFADARITELIRLAFPLS